jgi:hypothetical protein
MESKPTKTSLNIIPQSLFKISLRICSLVDNWICLSQLYFVMIAGAALRKRQLLNLVQQFQIQDFDRRSSVVAQLRLLTQLSTTIKDNAKMPEIDPCAGGV